MNVGMTPKNQAFLDGFTKKPTSTKAPTSSTVTKETIQKEFPTATSFAAMLTKTFDGQDSLMATHVTAPNLTMTERLENLKTILEAVDKVKPTPKPTAEQIKTLSEKMETLVADLIKIRTDQFNTRAPQAVSDKLVTSVIKQIKDTKAAKCLLIGSLMSSTGAPAPGADTPTGRLSKSLKTLLSNDTNKTGVAFKDTLNEKPSLSSLAEEIMVPNADGTRPEEKLSDHLLTHVKSSTDFDVLLGFDSTFISTNISDEKIALCKEDGTLDEDRTKSFLTTFKDALSAPTIAKTVIGTMSTTLFDNSTEATEEDKKDDVATKLNDHLSPLFLDSEIDTKPIQSEVIDYCITTLYENQENSNDPAMALLTTATGTDTALLSPAIKNLDKDALENLTANITALPPGNLN
ncbi:hypothetical protein HOH45_07005, partial [bacterium]|nr:hypothetical protein [bacterium]